MCELIEKHDPVVDCDCGYCSRHERDRLRAALLELTRMVPPETERANVRIVVYGNDARNFALRALSPNAISTPSGVQPGDQE